MTTTDAQKHTATPPADLVAQWAGLNNAAWQAAYDNWQAAYDNWQAAYDNWQAAYDNWQAAYAASMQRTANAPRLLTDKQIERNLASARSTQLAMQIIAVVALIGIVALLIAFAL